MQRLFQAAIVASLALFFFGSVKTPIDDFVAANIDLLGYLDLSLFVIAGILFVGAIASAFKK